MINLAETQPTEEQETPPFWIDADEELLLGASINEHFKTATQPKLAKEQKRAAAAPELMDCYNCDNE